tara:strand:- start:10722 stop:11303 length:582 start_codon:yes stop_codon:yes gene_type:complete
MISVYALRNTLKSQLLNSKIVEKQFDELVFKHFDGAKKKLFMDYDMHPVTRDLNNESNSGLVTKGTLFGFLGFESTDSPAESLRQFLERSINIRFTNNDKRNGRRKYIVNIPTKDDIYDATPLPWASGRSWVKAIEQGISGMGNYIDIESPSSRSGEGFQAKHSSGGVFRNTSYISTIINDFKKRLLSYGLTL